jgi:molybdopterin-containing oxidoreductase family membrane subunit
MMTVSVAGRELVLSPRLAYRAARAEIRRTPRALKAWYSLLLGLMAFGGVGAALTIAPGTEVFGTTPSFEWGILIGAYVFFAITTSGLCLSSSLGTVFGIDMFRPLEKRHAILALLSLTTAFGVIGLDLHYPVRMVFGAVFDPSLGSPMWWMGAFYAVYLVFLLVEVWSMFTGHPHVHRYACLASSCTAVLAPSTLGAVFGVLFARTYWSGLFTPITMLVTALLAGSAALGIAFAFVGRFELAGFERGRRLGIPAIRLLLAVALVGSLILLGRQSLAGLTSDDVALHGATMALVSGPLAIPFWVRLIGGLAIPLVLIALPVTRTVAGTGIASALVFVGVVIDRLLFVSAGQVIPTTAVGGVVSQTYVVYTPSLVEISIVLAAFAFVAFFYTLAERYLDMREAEVHVGFPLPDLVATARQRLAARRAARAAARAERAARAAALEAAEAAALEAARAAARAASESAARAASESAARASESAARTASDAAYERPGGGS